MQCNKTDTAMATKDFESKLEEELNLWAVRVFKRIRKNFVDYQINMVANKKEGYTGDLFRRMWWTVHTAAGGNKAMISFFYLKYGDFVQWGVGRKFGDPRWPNGQKLWDIPMAKSAERSPIKQTEGFNYAAKPFLRREVRYHMDWLGKRLAEEYGYFGAFWLERSLTEAPMSSSKTKTWLKEHMWELPQDFLDMFDIKRS